MARLVNGTNRCECDTCGEFFGGVGGFDLHRVFIDPTIEDWNKRRCLTPDELRGKGLSLSKDGFWVRPYPAGIAHETMDDDEAA